MNSKHVSSSSGARAPSAGKVKRHLPGNLQADAGYQALRLLLRASPEPIVVFDMHLNIILCNRATEHLFKRRATDVCGNSLSILFEDRDFRKKISPLSASERAVKFTCITHNKNGDKLDLNLRVILLKSSRGKKAGYIAFLTDMTERKFLERAFLEASEQEKKKIGQDLHDDLCQQLVGAAFATRAMGEDLRRKGTISEQRLADLSRLINEAVRQARDIVRGLRPVELDAGGLMSALDELLHKTNYKIPVKFVCTDSVLIRNSDSALQAYRIAQEALGDILRIGSANKLIIILCKKQNTVTMVIKAHGVSKKSFINQTSSIDQKIREYRVKAIDGQFALESEKPGVLRITCSFPEVK